MTGFYVDGLWECIDILEEDGFFVIDPDDSVYVVKDGDGVVLFVTGLSREKFAELLRVAGVEELKKRLDYLEVDGVFGF